MNLEPTTSEVRAAIMTVLEQFPRDTKRVRSAIEQQFSMRATSHEIASCLAFLLSRGKIEKSPKTGRWSVRP